MTRRLMWIFRATVMSTSALVVRNAATGIGSAAGGNAAGQFIGNSGVINITETAVAGGLGTIPGGVKGFLISDAVRSGLTQSLGNTAGSMALIGKYKIAVAPFETGITTQLPEVTLDLSGPYNFLSDKILDFQGFVFGK